MQTVILWYQYSSEHGCEFGKYLLIMLVLGSTISTVLHSEKSLRVEPGSMHDYTHPYFNSRVEELSEHTIASIA
jgi:hypothetical protein